VLPPPVPAVGSWTPLCAAKSDQLCADRMSTVCPAGTDWPSPIAGPRVCDGRVTAAATSGLVGLMVPARPAPAAAAPSAPSNEIPTCP